ncbi:beta-1,3-glucosyltransferase [Musca vetustissima]|uniref:beta-1,3-glucosyltransferase n=1 Tax=Musca vetustissima TaxID=27455 RepID=UPI002AB769BA|nr:beta-1,3-glucosyltransferase [Musca vetustissima]
MKILNCIAIDIGISSKFVIFIVLFLTKLTTSTATSSGVLNAKEPIEVVFLIRSQTASPHNQLGQQLKVNLTRQAVQLPPDYNYNIKVQILHELFNYPGEWTLLHIIPHLLYAHGAKETTTTPSSPATSKLTKQIDNGMELITNLTRWIIFCEETTSVNVRQLMDRLMEENHQEPLFLGHPLYDREPTIIHHFAFFENPKWFPYPMLGAGIVFSRPLLKSIADIFSHHNKQQQHQPPLLHSEFSIDAGHELARFIYDNVQMSEPDPAEEESEEDEAVRPVKTATTSSLNDSKSPDVTIYYRTTTTTSRQQQQQQNELHTHSPTQPQASSQPPLTVDNTHPHPPNDDGVDNASDFRHPNEIIDDDGRSKVLPSARKQKKKTMQKIILKKTSYICPEANWETGKPKHNKACVMYANIERTAGAAMPESCIPAKRDEIYFAVKTCSKFHKERLPIIQSTWAPYAKHIHYYSDVEDANIPTINTGIVNVEMGHCAKTLQILKLALRDIENHNNKNNNKNGNNMQNNFFEQKESHQIRWLLLTDDDTLLSVSGVCQVLGCYNSMDEIYMGERYGYRLHAPDGFNYITGGGGIAFSLPTLRRIVQHCSCPTPAAPDDMILGSCLHTLQMKALHSAHFHQARPNDYPSERLKHDRPVSFHKFWQIDPREVYHQWFYEEDDRMLLREAKDIIEEVNHGHGHPIQSEDNINYYHKNRNLLAKPEDIHDLNVPVSLIATLHQHSKERHVDL